MAISQNTALFSLLGTTYGGNGTTTFALPNLSGRAPLQQGQGPGLSMYPLGDSSGTENITLLQAQMPYHTHGFGAINSSGDSNNPNGAVPGRISGETPYTNAAPNTILGTVVQQSGGSMPHNNMMPYLVVNFCIAMQGIYPPRP